MSGTGFGSLGRAWRVIVWVFLAAGMSISSARGLENPPNIVVILADDFGVGDIQAHFPDNPIATPALDRLARQGLSFTDAHSSSAVCTPTRYGLLTGRYNWRTRLQEWVLGCYEPPLISEDRATLPQFLRDHGYRTACFGKWHLGWDWPGPQEPQMTEPRNGQKNLSWDFTQPIPGGPVDRGFDYYFGVDLPNMPPFTFIENRRVVQQPTESYHYDPQQGHVMPRGFEGCPMAPGWEFDQILPELTRRAVDKIHEYAAGQQPFFLYFSMTSPHEPVSPSEPFRGKSGIAPIADFVMETDWSAGEVIRAIDDAGIADNTIVIFTADNGHSHYTGWDELVVAGHHPSGPYRGHKGDVWEGGHRVPLIVRWPGRAEAGASSARMVCLTDLFATAADVLGEELDVDMAEDSYSFADVLDSSIRSSTGPRTRMINHSNFGEFAVRDGDWKLVYRMSEKNLQKSRGKPTVAELYDLGADIGESRDLASEMQGKVAEMTGLLEQMIERGATRPGARGRNDCRVDYSVTQKQRWAGDAP